MESSETCRTKALKSFAISRSGIQGVKDVRTGRLDTPLESGGTWTVTGFRNEVARLARFSQWSPDRKARHISSWGIRMELIRIALRAPCHPGEGSLHLAHGEKFYLASIPPHPDISYPDGKGGRSVRRHFTFGYLISGWRRGRSNFHDQAYPDPPIARTRRGSQHFAPLCSPEASRYGSCNLCMPYWIRDQEGRLVRIENPQDIELDICLNIMDPPQENQNSQHVQGDNPNAYVSIRDRMHPPRMSAPSCIVPPLEQLIIRPHIVPLVPNFHGMESENPYAHIKEFEEVCNTFKEGRASIDLMRLKLFPFTLKDKAKIWLNSLRPRSIRNWIDLQAEFLKKILPTHRTNGLKRQISNFSAQENEKFYECWERYMEASNACPHHGFDTWLLVSYFYDGISSSMKQILETMCGGDFMSKNPEEAMEFLSYVSEISRGWDEPNSREMEG
ncbi:hypothetical protein CK203_094637 [Vitis vinifera]|uniref:Retrotransposon gag domain-containing protein n=1 Tax=Vitis vinifera TaxID=29760 RepID=A0A438CKZ0_VITVI|nr:hypothetical protein CK203_094637 [Vitis vinifera]